jgi:Flp pilus assembly protein TadD
MDAFRRLGEGSGPRELDLFAAKLNAAGQWGLEAEVRERRLGEASDAPAYAAAARAWIKLGALERALERASTAARIDPGEARWHALRGEILMGIEGRGVEAIEAWTEAARLAPADLSMRIGRGRALLGQGVYAEAARELEEAYRLRPREREVAHEYARALAGMGARAEALRVLDRHLARDQEDAAGRALRAELEGGR